MPRWQLTEALLYTLQVRELVSDSELRRMRKIKRELREVLPHDLRMAMDAFQLRALETPVSTGCHNPNCPGDAARLRPCSQCRGLAKFCGRACQVAHWKAHKKVCEAAARGDVVPLGLPDSYLLKLVSHIFARPGLMVELDPLVSPEQQVLWVDMCVAPADVEFVTAKGAKARLAALNDNPDLREVFCEGVLGHQNHLPLDIEHRLDAAQAQRAADATMPCHISAVVLMGGGPVWCADVLRRRPVYFDLT